MAAAACEVPLRADAAAAAKPKAEAEAGANEGARCARCKARAMLQRDARPIRCADRRNYTTRRVFDFYTAALHSRDSSVLDMDSICSRVFTLSRETSVWSQSRVL